MNCGTFQESIVDRARGVALPSGAAALLESHLASCRRCAARFENERALTLGLETVARQASGETASKELEQRLLEAFMARHGSPSRRRSFSRPWLAAAAAVFVVACGGAWLASVLAPAQSGVEPADEPLAGFVALPVAAGLPAFESGTIVRVEVPVAALPVYGVEAPDPSRARVQLDVLVGQDGQARAIRLVPLDRAFATGVSRSRP